MFCHSYGGMLAAWMRFKYPNIIDAALAASAPIFMLAKDAPRDFFFKAVTNVCKNIFYTKTNSIFKKQFI